MANEEVYGRLNYAEREVHTHTHRVTKLEEWPPRIINVDQAIATLGSEYKALRETVEQSNRSAKDTRQVVDSLKTETTRGFSSVRGALYVLMVAIPGIIGCGVAVWNIVT